MKMAATGFFGLKALSIGPSSEGMGESSGLEGAEDIAADDVKKLDCVRPVLLIKATKRMTGTQRSRA
jgi:hypothetical protein